MTIEPELPDGRDRIGSQIALEVLNNAAASQACWDVTILAAGCRDSKVQANYHETFCDWQSMEPTGQSQIEYSDLMEGQEFLRGTWPGAANGPCIRSRIHYSESDFVLTRGVGHTTFIAQWSWMGQLPPPDPKLVNFSYAHHHGGMSTSNWRAFIRQHLERVRKRGPRANT